MAVTHAIAATGEVIASTEVTVTSALATDVDITLPAIGNGGGGTVAAQASISFFANAAGRIRVFSPKGELIKTVLPWSKVSLVAHGDATYGYWTWLDGDVVFQIPAFGTNAAQTPTLGATLPAGATTASSKWGVVIGPDGVKYYVALWTA